MTRYSSITGEGLGETVVISPDDTPTPAYGIVVSRERTAELELEGAVVRVQEAARRVGFGGEVAEGEAFALVEFRMNAEQLNRLSGALALIAPVRR